VIDQLEAASLADLPIMVQFLLQSSDKGNCIEVRTAGAASVFMFLFLF
jgi:hypothetical protein